MAGPDTNISAPPTPIWGFDPPSPEPDTKKLDALLDSLNGSAERFQTLWFSFLGLTLYLAIAALATTHRNLLLGEPQVLPILNIKVELLPFYVIAPLLYLVFHFYLLMMLALLARTAAEFEDELRKTLTDDAQQERYRARVENALFLQILIGMKPERAGFNGVLLGLIALITIVLTPLATLILIQMMFLPYHHLAITWWHRGLGLADLILIIVMWSRFFAYSGVENPQFFLFPQRGSQRARLAQAAYLGVVVVTFWLSFWEGRWAGEPVIGRPKLDWRGGVVWGLFPDRLNLANETVVGSEKWEKVKKEIASRNGAKKTSDEGGFVPTINLNGRDLQAADLTGADLRGVSLDGAIMLGAKLLFTRLDGAQLILAQLDHANLENAQLQGADLLGAHLEGANLNKAQLQGAKLNLAKLQSASLIGAQLQDAYLHGAHLEHAVLQVAQLERAHLDIADLRSADLQAANLQGGDRTPSSTRPICRMPNSRQPSCRVPTSSERSCNVSIFIQRNCKALT